MTPTGVSPWVRTESQSPYVGGPPVESHYIPVASRGVRYRIPVAARDKGSHKVVGGLVVNGDMGAQLPLERGTTQAIAYRRLDGPTRKRVSEALNGLPLGLFHTLQEYFTILEFPSSPSIMEQLQYVRGERVTGRGEAMHVITRRRLLEFSDMHPAAYEPLDRWYRITKRADWANFAEVREDFGSADVVGEYVVFNIGGNKFRLVVEFNYAAQRVLIRYVLTHKEYDDIDLEGE
jgi:mRNA interferase HigB